MAKKPDTLKIGNTEVPVTYNKNGKLDKKSRDAISKAHTAQIGAGLVKGTRIKPVDVAGFAGLTVAYYYGLTLLDDILLKQWEIEGASGIIDTINREILEGIGVPNEILDALPDTTPAGLITAGYGIFAGIPKGIAAAIVGESDSIGKGLNIEKISLEGEIADLEQELAVGHDKWGAPLSQDRIDSINAQLTKLRNRLDTVNAELADKKGRAAKVNKEIIDKAKVIKMFLSLGMAGATMWFLKSYEFSEFVENIPLIE